MIKGIMVTFGDICWTSHAHKQRNKRRHVHAQSTIKRSWLGTHTSTCSRVGAVQSRRASNFCTANALTALRAHEPVKKALHRIDKTWCGYGFSVCQFTQLRLVYTTLTLRHPHARAIFWLIVPEVRHSAIHARLVTAFCPAPFMPGLTRLLNVSGRR